MKLHLTTLIALSVAAAPLAAEQPPRHIVPPQSIIGAWQWTLRTNGCKETFIYRKDGSLSVTSGEEETKQTYTISPKPAANGRYKITKKVIEDYGGRDCADSDEDNTGQTSTIYVLFDRVGRRLIECFSPEGKDCVGPLHKMGH